MMPTTNHEIMIADVPVKSLLLSDRMKIVQTIAQKIEKIATNSIYISLVAALPACLTNAIAAAQSFLFM